MAEARARIHCNNQVRPEYIVEAAKLLQKSIIFVEMDDVSLDLDVFSLPRTISVPSSVALCDGQSVKKENEVQEQEEDEDQFVPQDSECLSDTPKTENGREESPVRKKKKREVHITYEKFESISNLVVMALRNHERNDTSFSGLTVNQCVESYLEQAGIENESDLEVSLFCCSGSISLFFYFECRRDSNSMFYRMKQRL